jgi:Tfp pilus assembly protein PilF
VFGAKAIAGLIGACVIAAASPAPPRAAGVAAETPPGNASSDLLPVLDQLAQTRLREGALDEAAALRRRALTVAMAASGGDSPSAAAAMAALAMVDIDRRRYLDAEPLLIVAQRLLPARSEANPALAATVYTGLARVALARGDTEPAERLARRAVLDARAEGQSAEPLRTLGAVLATEQHFDEAEQVLAEALAEDRKRSGPDGAATARGLSQLGNLYLRQGRAADALPLLEQAAAIDQQRLGPAHPFIADDLYDLGLVYDALKRGEEARRAFLASIAVLERGAERDTPRVAYAEIELSRLYRQQGNSAAANVAFKDARRILNKAEAEERKRERQV